MYVWVCTLAGFVTISFTLLCFSCLSFRDAGSLSPVFLSSEGHLSVAEDTSHAGQHDLGLHRLGDRSWVLCSLGCVQRPEDLCLNLSVHHSFLHFQAYIAKFHTIFGSLSLYCPHPLPPGFTWAHLPSLSFYHQSDIHYFLEVTCSGRFSDV